MHTFAVLADDEVIGVTHLESGDPPMGVAFGKFIPNERYAVFCRATALLSTGVRPVSIQTPDGALIPNEGAYIRDMSEEYGDEGREVEALGIPYPLYETLFPEHVKAYENQFK
ncbi:MAG: hypothetical protein ACK4OE_06315 [Acidovorax sp.]|uniref:hypothetical protein n=1 Tax=Acidovorax sp. TaxID=1872122 RepID=UPI003919BDB4